MKVNKLNTIFVISILLAFSEGTWASAAPITIRLSSEITQQQESQQEAEERERFYSNLESLVNLQAETQADDGHGPSSQSPTRTIQSIQDSGDSGE
ncbi:MAG: hypothetical protein JNM39_18205 [Bdellovibrionaceae bacterium]|nr:hypothetical protein [Pseudobdellovibrionaceae bacterium]